MEVLCQQTTVAPRTALAAHSRSGAEEAMGNNSLGQPCRARTEDLARDSSSDRQADQSDSLASRYYRRVRRPSGSVVGGNGQGSRRGPLGESKPGSQQTGQKVAVATFLQRRRSWVRFRLSAGRDDLKQQAQHRIVAARTCLSTMVQFRTPRLQSRRRAPCRRFGQWRQTWPVVRMLSLCSTGPHTL